MLKGKKIPISKYKSKKTQFKVTSDFSSQSSSESSSDSNLSVESISVKKEKKKNKMCESHYLLVILVSHVVQCHLKFQNVSLLKKVNLKYTFYQKVIQN